MKVSIPLFMIVLLCFTPFVHAGEKTGETPAGQARVKTGPLTMGCQFTVSSAKSTYRPGQSIPLHLEVENVNADAAWFGQSYFLTQYRFVVRHADGETAPLTLYGTLHNPGFGSLVFKNLLPGMKDSDPVPAINRLYDMTLEGEYSITAYRKIYPLNERQEKTEVPSNPLKITVTNEVEQQPELADGQGQEQAVAKVPPVVKVPVKTGPLTAGCQLRVTTPRATYRHDQPIPLSLEFKNVDVEGVNLYKTHLFAMYRFDIQSPDGEVVPLTLEGRLRDSPVTSAVLIKLQPGGTSAVEISAINRLYDMTLNGQYTITAYRHNVYSSGDHQKYVKVPSNSLKITVTDPDEPQAEQADDQTNDQPAVEP